MKCISTKLISERAEYSTLNPDGVTYSLLPFRLDSVLAGGGIANKQLKKWEIKFESILKKEIIGDRIKNIQIKGFVKRPGDYTYMMI